MSKLACHGNSFGKGAVVGMDKHNRRQNKEYGNPDIDVSKTAENYYYHEPKVSMYQDSKDMIEKRVLANKNRVRSDSNWISEFIVYAPKNQNLEPEREKEYFRTVHDYFVSKVGEENLLCSVVHKDEVSPHMHFSFCPITKDNRLSSKEIMTRAFLRQIHDELPQVLQSKGFDVQRGDQVKPEDRHKKGRSVKQYKADVEKEKQEVEKELEMVQFQVLEVESDSYRVQRELSSLLEQKEKLEKDVSGLSRNKNFLEKDIASLSRNRNVLEKDITSMCQNRDALSGEIISKQAEFKTVSDTLDQVIKLCDTTNQRIGGYLKEIDRSLSNVNALEGVYQSLQEFVMRSGRMQIARMSGVDFSQDHKIGEIADHLRKVLAEEREKIEKTKAFMEKAHPHLVYTKDDFERKALNIPTEKEIRHQKRDRDSR